MLSPQPVAAPSGERERKLKAGMVLFGCKTMSSRALYKSTYLYRFYFLPKTKTHQLVISTLEVEVSLSRLLCPQTPKEVGAWGCLGVGVCRIFLRNKLNMLYGCSYDYL